MQPFSINSDPNDVCVNINYHLGALVGTVLLKAIRDNKYSNPAVYSFAKQLEKLDRAEESEMFTDDEKDYR